MGLLHFVAACWAAPLVASSAAGWGHTAGWKELNHFLALGPVKRLSKPQLAGLQAAFKTGDTEEFTEKCIEFFRSNDQSFGIETFEQALQEKFPEIPDMDFDSLVRQLFKNQPSAQPVTQRLRQCGEDLEGLLLDVFVPQMHQVSGKILKCKREGGSREIILTVQTESARCPVEVHIEPDFSGMSVMSLGPVSGFHEAWMTLLNNSGSQKHGQRLVFEQALPEAGDMAVEGVDFNVIDVNRRTGTVQLEGGSIRLRIDIGETVGFMEQLSEWSSEKFSQSIQGAKGLIEGYTVNWAKLARTSSAAALPLLFGRRRTRDDVAKVALKVACEAGASLEKRVVKAEDTCDLEEDQAYDLVDSSCPSDKPQPSEDTGPIHHASMAQIFDVSADHVIWNGTREELDHRVRVRLYFNDKVSGVSKDNFEECVQLHAEGASEQSEKDRLLGELRDAEHQLRRRLKQNPSLFWQLVEAILTQNELNATLAEAAASACPHEKRRLDRTFRELTGSACSWSDVLANATADALFEYQINSRDMSHDGAKSPAAINRILQMVEEGMKLIEQMRGKKLIFLVGDTGSGKSTTASYFMNIKLEEKDGGMGMAVSHSHAQGPKIGESWCASQTLFAEGFPVPLLGSDFVQVDCPGFADTRGDDYSIVTGLSLDHAVQAASRITAIALVIPYPALAEQRGGVFLELLGRLQGRWPDILKPAQFQPNSSSLTDQGLHIIMTKGRGLKPQTIKSLERGDFARQALKGCEQKVQRLRDAMDVTFQRELCDMWRAVDHLGKLKRIHVLDLKDKVSRNQILRSLSASQIPNPKYMTSFYDAQAQKMLGTLVSFFAQAWQVQILDEFMKTVPEALNRTSADMCRYRHSLLMSQEGHAKDIQRVTADLSRLQEVQQNLHKKSQRQEVKLLSEVLGEISLKKIDAANESVERCKADIDDFERAAQEAASRVEQFEQNIKTLQSTIQAWKSGSTDDVLFERDYNTHERMALVYGCNDELDDALQHLRPANFSGCESRRWEGPIGQVRETVSEYILLSKEYRLIPKDEEQRRKFSTSLASEGTFGSTVAIVSGEKYSLTARKGSPDGRTVGYRIHWLFDGAGPFPQVLVVHRIPNIDYNEANLRAADANMSSLLDRRAAAKRSYEDKCAMAKDMASDCDQKQRELDQLLEKGAATCLEHQINLTQEELLKLEESKDRKELETALKQNESRCEALLGDLQQQHAQLAYTIVKRLDSLQGLVTLGGILQRILRSPEVSAAVNIDVLQHVESFQHAYQAAINADVRQEAADILSSYSVHGHEQVHACT